MNYGPELVASLVPELRRACGCQLQRIETGADWCIFGFKSFGSLFFTWNPQTFGICSLTSDELRELRSRAVKTPFAMGLARHLAGGSLTQVDCLRGDRVLKLSFRRFIGGGISKEYGLILELTGRLSNAIFVDENDVIIEAARHIFPDVNRYRSIVPGCAYTPPPPMSGTFPSHEMDDSQLCECLASPLGLGRPLAAELRRLAEGGFVGLVRDALFGEGKIYQVMGKYLTVCGVALPNSEVFDGDGLHFLNGYIAEGIAGRELKNIAARALKILERQRGRLAKHAEGLTSQIDKAQRCEDYRRAGEALLQNLGKEHGRESSATLKFWDENGEQFIDVALDPKLDYQGNAKIYFKKYKKFRTDIPTVQAKLSAVESDLADVNALISYLGRIDSAEKLTELSAQIEAQYDAKKTKTPPRKQKKTPPPHLRFSVGNSVILVGMNERGNRYVTFDEAAPNDMWFHVHEFPGSHVILKNPPTDAEELERCVRAAASLALCYSECGDSSSTVDYTEKKQVRHIAGAGPANVTYKHPSTVLVGPRDWEGLLRRKN